MPRQSLDVWPHQAQVQRGHSGPLHKLDAKDKRVPLQELFVLSFLGCVAGCFCSATPDLKDTHTIWKTKHQQDGNGRYEVYEGKRGGCHGRGKEPEWIVNKIAFEKGEKKWR